MSSRKRKKVFLESKEKEESGEDSWSELEKELRLLEKERKGCCSDSDGASAASEEESTANEKGVRKSKREVERSEDDSESDESEEDDESDEDLEESDSSSSDSDESRDDAKDGFDENVICAIPTPIPLPPMDSALRQAIKEGRLRDKSIKSRLVRISVDFYMSMKRYPSKEDYNNICAALIAAYPDLRDPLEIPGYPPFTQLKKKLIERMCHLRRARVTTKRKRSPERLDPSWILDARFASEVPQPVPPSPAPSRLPGFIPAPAPLPRFSADLRGVLGLGVPLVSKVRCKFLLACAEFYLGLKYHPTNEDFNNICGSLVDAFPKLADPGSCAGNVCFNNLKKDLSCYFCKFRRRHSQDKNRGDVGAGSWVDTLVLLEKDGSSSAAAQPRQGPTTSRGGEPVALHAPLPVTDRSAFDSFFNADPTQEDVERNIQQLKSLISELQ